MKCCWHTAWGTSGERVQEDDEVLLAHRLGHFR